MGRGRWLSLAACGLLLALGAGLLWWALAHQVGEPPSPAGTRHTASPAPSADGRADAGEVTSGGTRDTVDTPGTTGQTGEAVAPGDGPTGTLPASEPVAVRIPAIGVDSALHPLGLDADGALQVPSGERYDEAAWYDGSPTPGETGPSVIEGHVTSHGSVPSVFFELGAVEPGDLVEVDREDGSTATFEVYGARAFPKDSFPKATVYGNTGGPELRLITCGGAYDPELGAHVDNIVVFARLVDRA